MRKTAQTTPEPQLDREPDFMFEIVEHLEENPRPTAMTSKGYGDKAPAAKFQQALKVRNPKSGKIGIVQCVGTAKQFQYASSAFVEGYLSTDKQTIYVQPHLDRAGVSASDLI